MIGGNTMNNQMKVIMENWRKNILKEEAKIMTVGDLKKALNDAVQAKRRNRAASELTKTGAGIILDLIPGAGTIKNIADVLINVYRLPDEKRSNTGLDALNVDDEISAVLDDRVENQFIKDYLKQFEKVPDSTNLGELDMTQLLTDFIKQKYNNTTVQKG